MRRLALIILPALALLIVACGGDSSADKSALESLPADTSFILSARVADGLADEDVGTAFGSFSADTTGGFGSLEEALASAREQTGIDFAEVDGVVMAFGGALLNQGGEVASSEDETGLVMFVEGEFEREAVLTAFAAEEGALTTTNYKGHEVVASDSGGVVFFRDDLLALGEAPTLRAVIDVREGDAKPLSGPLLDTLDRSPFLAKAALTIPEGQLEEALADDALDGLPFNFDALLGFHTLGFSLDKVESDFLTRVALNYPNVFDAAIGAALLQSVVGLFEAFIPDPVVAALLEKTSIGSSGSQVSIDLRFNVDEIEELAEGAETLGELLPI
jgi:hypothetical protein